MGKTPPATGSALPPPTLKHSEPKTSSISSGKETAIGRRLPLKTQKETPAPWSDGPPTPRTEEARTQSS